MIQRFIPTAVGNAASSPSSPRIWPVHPHGCGERVSLFGFVPGLDGSSPRLWGTRIRPEAQYLSSRFIPTAVGNAHWMANQPTCSPVHPHGCGERICNERRHCHQGGSSPRLWGTRKNVGIHRNIVRFIPTAVGNAATWGIPAEIAAVHPHGCGERWGSIDGDMARFGSSPRLWGTLNMDAC